MNSEETFERSSEILEENVKENLVYYSLRIVQMEKEQVSHNSSETLICYIRKSFYTHKELHPLVHTVSRTSDHIPGKSACHGVWLLIKYVHICGD